MRHAITVRTYCVTESLPFSPPLLLALALAGGLHDLRAAVGAAVLAGEVELGALLAAAEVAVVDQEPSLAAVEVELELGDGSVGDVGKGGAKARLLGVDEADEDDVEGAVEVG